MNTTFSAEQCASDEKNDTNYYVENNLIWNATVESTLWSDLPTYELKSRTKYRTWPKNGSLEASLGMLGLIFV